MTTPFTVDRPLPAGAISKARAEELGLDQQQLHAIGLDHVRRLASRIWNDYNIHDPGVTVLELATYTLTDLTSRARWPVEDLLAAGPGTPPVTAPLFSARQILPGRALTLLDYRKLLIDLPGVKNAWLKPVELGYFLDPATGTLHQTNPQVPGIRRIEVRGVYQPLLELMDDLTGPKIAQTLEAADRRLHANRNLCEDFLPPARLEREAFRLCGEVELAPEADPARVKAEILFRVQRYLAPPVWNYTLSEMLERVGPDGSRYSAPDIFDGPDLQSGFYDDAELERADLRQEIRLSDIIGIVMDIPGVRAVRDMLIAPVTQQGALEVKWVIPVAAGRQPSLNDAESRVVFYKGFLPIVPVDVAVEEIRAELRGAERSWLESIHTDDVPVPAGRYRTPAVYTSFQNHFPAIYGVGETALGLENLPVPQQERRRAQVRQLKAYLLFLDQLMANYCSQLARVRDLFSADPEERRTYFAQVVEIPVETNFDIYKETDPVKAKEAMEALLETRGAAAARRNQFLDHLIARFAERFHDYAAIMYSLFGAGREQVIRPKCDFLQAYPELSAGRGLAYDYTRADAAGLWDSDNITGLERRVGRLLDLRDVTRRDLSDLKEDAFAGVEPVGAEFRFRVVHRDDPADVLLESRANYATAALARQAMREALRRGQWRESYAAKVGADGRPFFNLMDGSGGVLATRFFSSTGARDAEIVRLLQYFAHWYAEEGMFVVENILLRPEAVDEPVLPVCPDPDCSDCPGSDPYSYRIHAILPAYAGRFATMEFRRFAEALIRDEVPAHILPKICWISREDMRQLERLYRDWIALRAGASEADRSTKLGKFIDALYRVKNVYPDGQLRACERGEDSRRFILGRSALGTASAPDE
jgi:hypothetical protein